MTSTSLTPLDTSPKEGDSSFDNSLNNSFDTSLNISITEDISITEGNNSIENDPNAVYIYTLGKKWASKQYPTPTNIVALALLLVKEIQTLVKKRHMGDYKKRIVIDVLKHIMRKDVKWKTELDRESVLFIIEETLPSVIDISVQVALGDFNIGKMKKSFKLCCGCI